MTTLSRYVTPDLSEARLARQLDNVSSRLASRGRGKWLVAASAVVACAIVVALLAWPRDQSQPIALVESAAAGQTLTLADGSSVVLDANTRLRLADARPTSIRLELERGGVEVEATHRSDRRFVVVAASREVRVVGTHFFVRFSGDARRPQLEVIVDRGVVEVAEPGGSKRRVVAGESWTTALEEAHASSAPPAPAPPEPSADAAPAASTTETGSASAPKRPQESAKQLFARAQRARAAGRSAEARAAFSELRRRYPDDPRAPLAAFELGRMQIDADEDPAKAAELFDEALKHSPQGSSRREDAEARRIEALARVGDRAGCAAARDAYLKRYPKGVHRARVVQACR